METIPLYQAIVEMRKLTSQGKTFTFIHSTYNSDTKQSQGIRVVRKAKVRAAARKDDLRNADYKLFYYDFDVNEPRNCWQCLIMFFNNKKILLD
jgi:hypothetical protein